MKTSDNLYSLIKLLTQTEKRFFKLSASIHKGEKNTYMRLFEVIDKQKQYNEGRIKEKLKAGSFTNQLTS